MTKHRLRFLLVSLTVGILLAGGSLMAVVDRNQEPEPDSFYKYLSVFTEVLGLVQQTYVEETDVEALMAGAFEGTANALDAFSVYIPPGEVARFERAREELPPDTGMFLIRDRGWVYIAAVADGSTAATAGLEAGDLLSRIEGESTRELDVWEIHALLGERAGGEVDLELIRQGDTVEVTLSIEESTTPAVTTRDVDGVRVLRIARFAADTELAVRRELAAAPGDRLLLDLRGVSGGDPDVAFAVARLFATGHLGSLEKQGRVEAEFEHDGEILWTGDLALLADRATLGPAEILVQVLQERADARFVGEPTYGWAGRSDLIPLSSGGMLVLTGAFYAGPSGEILDGSLEPDVRVTGRDRTLSEKDLTLDELILRRGVELLLDGEAERVAA